MKEKEKRKGRESVREKKWAHKIGKEAHSLRSRRNRELNTGKDVTKGL